MWRYEWKRHFCFYWFCFPNFCIKQILYSLVTAGYPTAPSLLLSSSEPVSAFRGIVPPLWVSYELSRNRDVDQPPAPFLSLTFWFWILRLQCGFVIALLSPLFQLRVRSGFWVERRSCGILREEERDEGWTQGGAPHTHLKPPPCSLMYIWQFVPTSSFLFPHWADMSEFLTLKIYC